MIVDWPMVSVFMPTYNHEDYIGAAIESVVAQNYHPIEIIIGDDLSTDNTVAVVREYMERYPGLITPIFSQHNTGIPSNFNRILEKCNGEYVAILSGDDLWMPGKLHRQIALMEIQKDVAYCYSDCEIFDSNAGTVLGLSSEISGLGKGTLKDGDINILFYRFSAIKSPTIVYRRESIGDVRFDTRLKHANDYLFDLEILAKGGRVVALNEVLARYRKHGSNITSSPALRSTVLEEELITESIIQSRYPHLLRKARNKVNVAMISDIAMSLQVNNKERAYYRMKALMFRGYFFKSIFVYLLYRILGRNINFYKRSLLLNELARKYIYR